MNEPPHHGVEHAGGLFRLRSVCAAATRFEADGVDTAIDLRVAEDISGRRAGGLAHCGSTQTEQRCVRYISCRPCTAPQLLVDGQSTGHVHRLAAHAAGLSKTAGVEIADDDAGGAEQLLECSHRIPVLNV